MLSDKDAVLRGHARPNITREGDLHVAGSMKTAWFKDPDGNILGLVTPPSTAARQTASASARSTA